MLLRLAIALVTFAAGVATATVFSAVFGVTPASSFNEMKRPDPPRRRPCPHSRQSLSELPPLPEMPPPAMPAMSEPVIKKRVTIKLPDGSVQVVESRVVEQGVPR
jgi:hypothetical protein